jgi:hypothetical protein
MTNDLDELSNELLKLKEIVSKDELELNQIMMQLCKIVVMEASRILDIEEEIENIRQNK